MMLLNTDALLLLVTLILGWAIYKLVLFPDFVDHLRLLPGPKRASYLRGNSKAIFEGGPGELHKKWIEESDGLLIKYHLFFGRSRLTTIDPKALQHILLAHAYDYPKPQQVRGQLAMILGKGILFAEGDSHRRQKRLMVPSFTEPRVRELVDIFYDKTAHMVSEMDKLATAEGGSVMDLTRWLSRVTLDIIGLAGFGYEFNALNSEDGSNAPLYSAFKELLVMPMQASRFRQFMFALTVLVPAMSKLPTPVARKMKQRLGVMQSEGHKIIEKKRAESRAGTGAEENKDLISLLIKANDAEDSKSKMSDEELMGQITTFQLAGHETSSSALTWALHQLSLQPELQEKLRSEIRQAKADLAPGSHLSADEVSDLPYLDAVVKETLRLCAPVSGTMRTVAKDDVLPLSRPITLKNGQQTTSVEVKKGDIFFLSITAFNQSTEIWGEDAAKFRPERWLEAEKESSILGQPSGFLCFSRLMTFLGGPRQCIGFRFSVLEIKVLLSELVAHFSFLPPDDKPEIIMRTAITIRPVIKGREKEGAQLPLKVQRAAA